MFPTAHLRILALVGAGSTAPPDPDTASPEDGLPGGDSGVGDSETGDTGTGGTDTSDEDLTDEVCAHVREDATEMTSFLGCSVWGELCLTNAADEPRPTHSALVQRTMQLLFGNDAGEVSLAREITFLGRDYAGNSREARRVRRFVLSPRDTVSVGTFVGNVASVRRTPESRYVFREFNCERLALAAADPPVGEACRVWDES